MGQVRLKEPKAAQWNIGGRFLQGGSIQELTDKEIKNHSDVIEEILDKVEVIEIPKTEKELFALSKDEQINILRSLDIKKTPRLESGRVQAILKAIEERGEQ